MINGDNYKTVSSQINISFPHNYLRGGMLCNKWYDCLLYLLKALYVTFLLYESIKIPYAHLQIFRKHAHICFSENPFYSLLFYILF